MKQYTQAETPGMALPALPNLQPASEVALPPQTGLTESDPNAEARTPPDLERLKRYFTEYRDLTADARVQSIKDIDYYDSKQWSSEEQKKLAERHQPDTVFNYVKIAINGIIGVNARGKADPRAWPRTPQDEGSADVATDVLRYAADFNRFQRTKLDCLKDMLVPGTMAVIVGADGDLNPTVTQVRWEEFFADPRSRRPDFKDARYLGVAKWMYADDVGELYPDKLDAIRHAVDNSVGGGLTPDASFQDRPNWAITGWIDKKQRRLLVIEIYYRERGEWARCVFHGSGILDEGDSPYLDHKGRPHCPIEAQSAYVDIDNFRYGVVRDMRPVQDEINKRRSKLLHLLNVAQIQPIDAMALSVDVADARKEAARPDGVLPAGYQKVSTSNMASGQAELLADAVAMLDRQAPNPAIMGRGGTDQSGRALLARQQGGLVELAPIYNAAEDWELRVYRQIWARVKQYWRDQQYIRVTDDEGAPRFVSINEPQYGAPIQTIDPSHPAGVSLQPPILGYKNQIGEMDVDIEVDTQQDVGTLAQEQFSDLMQMLRSNPAWQQSVPLEVMIKLSSIPHKQALIDQIKAAREQAQGEAQQADAQKQQVAAAAVASQIEERKARTGLYAAQAGQTNAKALLDLHDAHASPHLDMLKAGLDAGEQDANQPQPGMPPQGPQPGAPQPMPAPQ